MNEQMTELDMYDPLPFDARLSIQEQEEDELFRQQAGLKPFIKCRVIVCKNAVRDSHSSFCYVHARQVAKDSAGYSDLGIISPDF